MKKLLYTIILIFTLSSLVFTEVEPIVFDDNITGLVWTEKNYLLCSLYHYGIMSISTDGSNEVEKIHGESAVLFDAPSYKNDLDFVFMTDDLSLKRFNIDNGDFATIFKLSQKPVAESLVISPTSSKVIIGFDNGLIGLLSDLKLQNSKLHMKFIGHKGGVHSVDFNATGKYLLTASTDNNIKLWETNSFSLMKVYSFYGDTELPVRFSPVYDVFASAFSDTKITIKDLKGRVRVVINTKEKIKNFKFSKNGGYLIVQNILNELLFYNTSTADLDKIMPSLTKANVLDYDTDPTSIHIAIAYDNGMVYLTDISSALLPPNKNVVRVDDFKDRVTNVQKKKVASIIKKEVIAVEKESASVENPPDGKEPVNTSRSVDEKDAKNVIYYVPKKDESSLVKKPSKDAIEIRISFQLFTQSKAFLGSVNSDIGYFFNRWLQPFYFGINARFGLGLPKKDFPHDYYVDGKKIRNPHILNIGFHIPVGFAMDPFNNGFRFSTELSTGVELKRMWNLSFTESAYSKFFVTPSISVTVGVGYKWFMFHAGISYDKVYNFSVVAGLGFRIEVGGKNKKELKNDK